ncbi:Long-chain-fatty-acid--CoA ligase 5 [Geodia barretti]|uniref:long-chain-fatty-acid--CoA ligase n=1 Tax=Geodia barretti TaxID=519541 RepID=A0AA35RLV8_GEOBA|nr:Long-chain-fatty-acid--CoA ligase 5 [Geodia barretti]
MSASRKDASSSTKRGGYAALTINYRGSRADGGKHHGECGGINCWGECVAKRPLPSQEGAEVACRVLVVRGREEGGRFQSEFPTLEEQETIGKREPEEVKGGRDGSREHSPSRPRAWGDHHPPHGPPFPPGPYPPHHYGPYMMHPSIRHPAPLFGGGPMTGGKGYPPPPHQMGYGRPPFPPYPQQNPFEVDPYKMPPARGEEGAARPRNAKQEDLHTVEILDEEEGGWAGHHDEVDYSKEVVFSDSDEEESPKKERKEKKTETDSVKTVSKVCFCFCEEKMFEMLISTQPVESSAVDTGQPPDKKHSPPPSSSSVREPPPDPSQGDWRDPPRPPQSQRPDSPSERKSRPHPYPMYPPPFPAYYGDPYNRYPMFPPHGIPPYGFHPPPRGHSFGGRAGNRRRSERDREREEVGTRHDFHPFDHGPEQVGSKRKWNEEKEVRPKLLVKERDWRESAGTEEKSQTTGGGNKRSSASSEPAAGGDAVSPPVTHSKEGGEEEEQKEHSPPVAVMRAQPKKIMLRKMSDGSKSDTNEGLEESGRTGDRTNDSKSQARKISGDHESSDATGNVAKSRPTAWKTNERPVGSVVKTLYEPEGKRSEAKFRKYQHDARAGRERGGPSPATTPSETNPPATTPDSAGKEKVSFKRTFSGDKGRRGRDNYSEEEENLKWAEPLKNQRDKLDLSGQPGGRRERSVPPNEPKLKDSSKAPAQSQREQQGRHVVGEGGRQEGRGRRERNRTERRSRGSEADEGGSKSRTGSESEFSRWQRDDGEDSPHHRRTRGERTPRGEPRSSRTHRLPSKEDRVPSKELPPREPQKNTSDFHSSQRRPVHSASTQEPLVHGPQGAGKTSTRLKLGGTPSQKEDRMNFKEDKTHPREDGVPQRREGRDVKARPSGKAGGEAATAPSSNVTAGRTSVSTAPARTVVPTTTATTTTVSLVPASVPQSVINKSVMVKMTETSPLIQLPLALPSKAPLALPTQAPLAPPTQLLPQSVRRPLLDDPPLPLRQDPLLLGRQVPPLTGRPEVSNPGRRGPDSVDGRRRQGERRKGGGDAGRGGRRASQRGRGGERGARDGQQERRESIQQTSSQTVAGTAGEAEQGKGKEERGRGGRGRSSRERKPGPSSEEKKPAQQEGEGGRRGESGGRGREKRRNQGRRSEFSRTDSGEVPQRRNKDSGRMAADEQRGGREEQRRKGKDFGRERQTNKPSPVQEERKIVNLTVGYGSLEDIDSDSDWEQLDESKTGDTKKEVGEVSAPRDPPKGRGRGQRRNQERQDSQDQQRNSARGKGRGRGRTGREQPARERQSGRPGANRQDRNADNRVPKPEPSLTAASDEASSEKPADVHKQQEFAKYDLHSSTIAIVDEIRGVPDETESSVDFVEVTSKKAQKEKVKKEREEQLKQSLATDFRDDQRKNRKPAAAKSSEQTTLPLKPSMAWSSKGEDQSNIWSTSSPAPTSDWGTVIRPSTSAPGAELKEPAGGWVAASYSVGVIGDSLQARNISTALCGHSELLPSSAGYSLFPDYSISSLLTPGQYAGGGRMLNAAVNMKLSKEHLTSEATVLSGPTSEGKDSAPLLKKEPQRKSHVVVQPPLSTREASRESSSSATGGEGLGSSHGGSRSGAELPPRLQSSRGGGSGGSGRGRGGGRGRRVERGRRGGSGEQKVQQDVPGEGKRENQQSREHTAKDKSSSGRFYVPPPVRGEGGKAARPSTTQPPSKSKNPRSAGGSSGPAKVPSSSIKVAAVGVASDCHVTDHMTQEVAGVEAEGTMRDVHGSSPQQHQSSRAGSGGGGVWEEEEGISSALAGKGEAGGAEISSKTGAASAKTFSYAQALKTSLADSSWSTSRSHTPSDTSLMLDTRTPTPVQVQVPSPTPVSVPTPNSLDSPACREDGSPSQLSSPLPSTGNTASPDSTEEKVPAHDGDDVIITLGASPEGEVAPVVTSKESVGEDSQPLNDWVAEEGGGKEVSGERKEDMPATTAAKSEEISGCGLQQAPPPGKAQSQVQRGTPERLPNPLPPQPAQEPMATRQVEPLLQMQPSAPISSLDQPVLPQKQWLRPLQAQARTRQPRLVEQPRLQASRPDFLSSVQSKPQHLQLQAQLQLKQQQLQQLILMAQKQQPQLLHQQHSQRVLQHRQQGFYESASVTRLPTPPQPLQLLGPRPLMTTPTHQGLAVASPHQMPHPQSLLVLQSPHLQHTFHPPSPSSANSLLLPTSSDNTGSAKTGVCGPDQTGLVLPVPPSPEPRRRDLLLHDPTHHQKVAPSLSDSTQGRSLVGQAKLLPMFHPQGHAGLIRNPYTAGGVTFVPPVAIPTASLTTPTPTPSPQALSLATGGLGLAGKKASAAHPDCAAGNNDRDPLFWDSPALPGSPAAGLAGTSALLPLASILNSVRVYKVRNVQLEGSVTSWAAMAEGQQISSMQDIPLDSQSLEIPDQPGVRCSRLVRDGQLQSYLLGDVRTLYHTFQQGKKASGDGPCLGWRGSPEADYQWTSYGEIEARAVCLGAGLSHLGIPTGPETNVGVFAPNSIDWVVTEQSCNYYSRVLVPLYDTLGAEALVHILNQAEMSVVLCNSSKLATLSQHAEQCPSLKTVVTIGAEPAGEEEREKIERSGLKLFSMKDVEVFGADNKVELVPPTPDTLATICYTSGTTGRPKGVMLSHGNIIANMTGLYKVVESQGAPSPDDVHISYLPLAHMLERVVHCIMFMCGGRIAFFGGDIKRLVNDIQVVRPTIFVSVPRLLNRIYDKITAATAQASIVKKTLFNKAMKSKTKDLRSGLVRQNSMWDKVVLKKVRSLLGGRVRMIFTGSAPIAAHVLDFLRAAFGCQVTCLHTIPPLTVEGEIF